MICPFMKNVSEPKNQAKCRKKNCQLWLEVENFIEGGDCSFAWIARTMVDKIYFFDKEDKK